MKRDIVITFSLFTLLILLLLGSVFTANAGQGKGAGNSGGNGGGIGEPSETIKREKKAEISAKKITEKIKKQKGNSKAGEDEYETGREFPMMFDIADRAQKHKAKKGKQK